jgi:aspartate aminotransferase
MTNYVFSNASRKLSDSITHGTREKIILINQRSGPDAQVVDLSIGTLDRPADRRIDEGVCEFIRKSAETIHAFAPVKGFPFLRKSLAAKIERMHGVKLDSEKEILVTPGGIKGTLTVLFHTFLNPGEEVIIPSPNWPHYAEMLYLHQAEVKFVPNEGNDLGGITPQALKKALSANVKLIILGDCINPTGKVYTTAELRLLAQVVAEHNVNRQALGQGPVHVLFDCPYEAHIRGQRAMTFAAIEVDLAGYGRYAMRSITITVSGPGKTYGMHGDRIGYAWAPPEVVEMAARVQVNTNSFASTYGQVATHIAVQEEMDAVALERASHARQNLEIVRERLSRIDSVQVASPDGGYFLFVDFTRYANSYERMGYTTADLFLLQEARVASIGGLHFGPDQDKMRHFVRLNCGRSIEVLNEACSRIENAIASLREVDQVGVDATPSASTN